jgi:hypothetical protein
VAGGERHLPEPREEAGARLGGVREPCAHGMLFHPP